VTVIVTVITSSLVETKKAVKVYTGNITHFR
jgi:hypothetical protein